MTHSRRVLGWVVAGIIVAASMLLVAPVGSAADRRSAPPPPPAGERTPVVEQLLPLPFTLVPAVASAGTQIKVLGNGFMTCATVQGELASAGNGGVSGMAAGDVSLYWDGVDLVPIVQLDEYLEFVANVELAQGAAPGGQQVAPGCADDEEEPGSADAVPGPAGAATGLAPPAAAETGRSQSPADAPGPGSAATDQTQADADLATLADPGAREVSNLPLAASAESTAEENFAESLAPGIGPASWGLLVGVLGTVGAALIVPAAISFALQNRRGPKWVRANVRAEAAVVPAVIQMTPQLDCPWPSLGVRLALRTDSGNQALTEVRQ